MRGALAAGAQFPNPPPEEEIGEVVRVRSPPSSTSTPPWRLQSKHQNRKAGSPRRFPELRTLGSAAFGGV